jgi:hypothetical protein
MPTSPSAQTREPDSEPIEPSSSSSGARVPILVTVTVALLLTTAALWAASRGGDSAVPLPGVAAPERAGPIEVAHVHDLGVDPTDGMLLAGTHYGLFRLPDGGAGERVGDVEQDFMGFTVLGPGHYLASGHPGTGQDGPSSLGLIESTDGGQTWQTLSLAGEADFHALEARHDLIYGYDALDGDLLVSGDGRNWETRGSGLEVADLAVSPDDPELLLITTAEGPAVSRDGGRSFSVLDGAPVLLLVDWAEDGALVGVEPDGTVHASDDSGESWSPRGSIGAAPQAMKASDGTLFVAVEDAILESSDGGASFRLRTRTG